jgi:serine/threonine-protein kinase
MPGEQSEASCPRCDRDHDRGAPECHGQRVGKVFAGKYRVVRILGAGGMGVVYEVEHLTLGRRSALKLLLGRRSASTAIERFKREAQRLAALKSEAIVQVFDAGHDDEGTPYLEMELLAGASLEELVRKGGLGLERAVAILRGALIGLEVAHAAGFIHRDIKPDNLFVVGDPRSSTAVKLLDFGIAKATSEEEGLTREGALLGTAYFMSPEHAESAAKADERSDVYSMGATLFRALTGAYPVEPGPTLAVVACIVTGRVARHPREVVPAIPTWLDLVVARAMAHAAVDRYASARAMRDALDAGMAPASTEADTDEPDPVATSAARGAEATQSLHHVSPAALISPTDPVSAPTRRRPALVAGAALVIALGSGAFFLLGSNRGHQNLPVAPTASAGSTTVAPAISISATTAPRARMPPPAGMVAMPSGLAVLGTPDTEQAGELARCQAELAIDARDCTPERLARERPQSVELGAYDIDALEVTNESLLEWAAQRLASKKAILDAHGVLIEDGAPLLQTGSEHAGIDAAAGALKLRLGFRKRPAVLVSWLGATRFCAAQGKRLPREAEWEAAARDGQRAEFPWGNEAPACDEVAFGGLAHKRCAISSARDVGKSPRDVTRSGVRDLGGNVMEWVDGAGDTDDSHVFRGGSWAGSAFEARSARRRFGKSAEMLGDVGFRCARSPEGS